MQEAVFSPRFEFNLFPMHYAVSVHAAVVLKGRTNLFRTRRVRIAGKTAELQIQRGGMPLCVETRVIACRSDRRKEREIKRDKL